MKLITDKNIIDDLKLKDSITFECEYCHKHFKNTKKRYGDAINPNRCENLNCCSMSCSSLLSGKRIKTNCNHCQKEISLVKAQYERFKNHFCSHSCNARYSNSHKVTGIRRSKLEVWLELKLKEFYPKIEIHFNRRDTILSELDIYLPSLKLAFELNGIFHYEPIFGEDRLSKTQNNDKRKYQACIERGISLCVIDTHNHKYFKKEASEKFLKIVKDIIDEKMAASVGF